MINENPLFIHCMLSNAIFNAKNKEREKRHMSSTETQSFAFILMFILLWLLSRFLLIFQCFFFCCFLWKMTSFSLTGRIFHFACEQNDKRRRRNKIVLNVFNIVHMRIVTAYIRWARLHNICGICVFLFVYLFPFGSLAFFFRYVT